MSEVADFLRRLDIFNGLSDEEFLRVAELCRTMSFKEGDTILNIGDPTEDFYVVRTGTVHIITNPDILEAKPELADSVVITLGKGQTFGEMGLVDRGARSATVQAASDTDLLAISCDEFLELCHQDTHLGFLVMQNIAIDLSFKLRYRNLI